MGSSTKGLARLRQIAEEEAEIEAPDPISDRDAIVAARPLDLSGILACSRGACIKKQVDTIFYQAWHYFDVVVAEGASLRIFLQGGGTYTKNFDQHVQVVLYLRDSGANSTIQFQEKPHAFCEHHFEESARKAGIDNLLDSEVRGQLISEMTLAATLKKHG